METMLTEQDAYDLMAHLGMATWMGQSLEQALTVWVVAERLVEEGNQRHEGDADPHFKSMRKMTLGQLAGPRIDELSGDEPEFARRLSAALAVRNDLAHRFHRRHAGALINKPALEAARQECIEACDRFRQLLYEVMKRVELTGVGTGGATLEEAVAWAENLTRESLEGGIPSELTEEVARLFAKAGAD